MLNRGDPLAKGLVAAWLFNDSNGSRIGDSVGSLAGTLTNVSFTSSSGWAGGLHGSTVFLDGTNDFVQINPGGTAVPAVLQVQAPFTIAAVAFTTRRTNYDCMMSITSAFSQTTSKWSFHPNGGAGGKLALDGNGSQRFSTSSVPTGQWNFLAASVETSQCRFNLNGTEETSATGMSAITYGTEGVSLGKWGSTSSGFMQGGLGGVWLWNGRALTATQLTKWMADPFRMFRRRSVPVPLHVTAAPASSGLLLKRRRMMA